MTRKFGLATLLLAIAFSANASERQISENAYVKVFLIEDSFELSKGFPSILARTQWKDGSSNNVRRVAVEGCANGEGTMYYSGGGKADATDSWDASDNTSGDVIAKLICRMSKNR